MKIILKVLNEEIQLLQTSCYRVQSIYLKKFIKVMAKECLQNDKELHRTERQHAQISVYKKEL
jgi:hypothetical protein